MFRAGENQKRVEATLDNPQPSVVPGSSTTLAVALANRGLGDDYFEISMKGVPLEWVSIESPVVHLGPGGKGEISLTIQPPFPPEGRAGIFPFVIEVVSQGNPQDQVELGGILTVAAFQLEGRIGILLASTQFSVAPGSKVTIPILLINHGLEADTFHLHVTGIPSGWISTPSAIAVMEPGHQYQVELTIQPPHTPESEAGRHPFGIKVTGDSSPDQAAEVDCILTIAATSEFSCKLLPEVLALEQVGRIVVKNDGNIPENFSVSFQSQGDVLIFERVMSEPVQTVNGDLPRSHPPVTTEMGGPQSLQIPPGETGSIEFRAQPLSQPIFGGVRAYPFNIQIQSSGKITQTLRGEMVGKAPLPQWVFPVIAIFLVSCLCLFAFSAFVKQPAPLNPTTTAQYVDTMVAAATQTAAFNQTQAVITGQEDTDSDGLTNLREMELGTDPTNADTDRDELSDGREVNDLGTHPLNPDTDGDRLSDGDEVLRRGTAPTNPDSDQDGVTDGDEVQRGIDPLKPDTDADSLNDREEISLGTDPRNPDTDGDRLLDGKESPPCPSPLKPDTDGDGIIDSLDLDPCDAKNPSLTATAIVVPATPTSMPPTQPAPTPSPTIPPVQPTATSTPPPGAPHGLIAFESNRDGNSEVYALSTTNLAAIRLTNDLAVDTNPVWSPDGARITFASNRAGNFDIYVMNVDGTGLINLTNHPADDREPVWSPDGTRLAFTTNRDGNSEIYTMNANGSSPVNLTNNPAEDIQPTWFISEQIILFSPDSIAFTSNRDGNLEVYSMAPDGKDQVNLSMNPANDSSPAAVRDGNQLVFVTNRDGNNEIYVMGIEGDNQDNLTKNPADDQYPSASPNSAWLAFNSNREGNPEVYLLNLDTFEVVNITRNPAQDLLPAWLEQ